MSIPRTLTEKLERAEVLDRPADLVADAVGRIVAGPRARALLGGRWLGHPIHPLLVTVPIGTWTGALVLDVTAKDAAAARHLVGVGVLSAIPTMVAGTSDWSQTTGAPRRVGLVHAASNAVALAFFGGSWVARRRSRALGVALALAGSGALSVGGYLGGHLSYVEGVGVEPADDATGRRAATNGEPDATP